MLDARAFELGAGALVLDERALVHDARARALVLDARALVHDARARARGRRAFSARARGRLGVRERELRVRARELRARGRLPRAAAALAPANPEPGWARWLKRQNPATVESCA